MRSCIRLMQHLAAPQTRIFGCGTGADSRIDVLVKSTRSLSPSRMWRLALMAFICVAPHSACGTDDDEVSSAACTQMREHMLDLQLADASHVDREAHRAVLRRSLGNDFVDRCKTTMSASQVRCVRNSANSTAAASCVTSSRK